MTRVLVTDGQSIAALAVVRALGRQGFQVTCGETSSMCPTFFSRHVSGRFRYAEAESNPSHFILDICKEVARCRYDAVIPVRDATSLALAANREMVEPMARVLVADHSILTKGRDKRITLRAAEECGVPHPQTLYPENCECGNWEERLGFPVLIKPAESSGTRGIARVDSADMLRRKYESAVAAYGACMIQELVPGTEMYCYSALYHEGTCVREFMQVQTRNYPVHGGTAACAQSIVDKTLRDQSRRLLDYLGWDGIAHVEFKKDPRTGTLKLMEVNPRFWMSLQLAIASGVDFPSDIVRLSTEGYLPPQTAYREGVTYRWLFPADILWFLSSKTRFKEVASYARFFSRRLTYAVLSLHDPLPLLGAVLQSLRFLASAEKRQFTFRRGW